MTPPPTPRLNCALIQANTTTKMRHFHPPIPILGPQFHLRKDSLLVFSFLPFYKSSVLGRTFLCLTTIWRQKLCPRHSRQRIIVPWSLSPQLTFKTKVPHEEKQAKKMGTISATIHWWGRVSLWEKWVTVFCPSSCVVVQRLRQEKR